MSEPVRVECRRISDQSAAAMKWHSRAKTGGFLWRFLPVVVVFVTVVGAWLSRTVWYGWWLLELVILLAWAWVAIQPEDDPYLASPQNWEFSENHIRMTSELGVRECSWARFWSAILTPRGILMYETDPGPFHWLPSAACDSPLEFQRLINLVRKQLPVFRNID
jgi:hypothetical protein